MNMFTYLRKLVADLYNYQDPVPEITTPLPNVTRKKPAPSLPIVEDNGAEPKKKSTINKPPSLELRVVPTPSELVVPLVKPKPTPEPLPLPKRIVKQHFARVGEKTTLDPNLPTTEKSFSGRTISVNEIPFESTRSQLVQLYVVSMHKCIREARLGTVPGPQLVSHYLFLKTLAASEDNSRDKELLTTLASSVGNYLKTNENSLWKLAKPYADNSEYPIIGWIKSRQLNQNFLLSFLHAQNSKPFTHQQKAFINNFKQTPAFFFPNQVYMAWLAQSYEADSAFKPFASDGSTTQYYHSNITDNLLLRTRQKEVTLAREHFYRMGRDPVNTEFRFDLNRANLVGIQGRTLLFSGSRGQIVAVKVQKEGEPKTAFTEEYQMAAYLNKHRQRLDLESELPTPLGQHSISRAALQKFRNSPGFDKLQALIADKRNLEVYVYRAPSSYFTYLHNSAQTLEQFSAAVKKNTHDLFVLLREGIVFPQLADMFHTHSHENERTDQGRYQALVNLLRLFQTEMGRVDKWKEAVKYVNLRASGPADLGDSTSVNNLLTVSAFTQKYYSELLSGGLMHPSFLDRNSDEASSLYASKRRVFGNYLFLNIMAEYLLVLQLTIGSYGDAITRNLRENDKKIVWKQLSELMFSSCALTVSVMTGIPESRAMVLIQQRASINQHAKQTGFWMTPDYAALGNSQIRAMQYELYSGESAYDVRDSLVEGVGMAVDGEHQDLGGYNQASPLKELEKILYATVTLIEATQQLDKQFLNQMQKVENFLKVSKKADECYSAVAQLMDMARPGAAFQKTLALSYYKSIKEKFPGTDSEVDARFENVEKQDAARKLYHFWKERHVQQKKSDPDENTSLKPRI
jgi:hypothetical protein